MNRTAISLALCLGLVAAACSAQACTLDTAKNKPTVRKDGAPYAGAQGKPWYAQGRPVTIDGASYRRQGSPRVFGEFDLSFLEKAGEFEGVLVFKDTDQEGTIFVPVDAKACTFQAYQKAD